MHESLHFSPSSPRDYTNLKRVQMFAIIQHAGWICFSSPQNGQQWLTLSGLIFWFQILICQSPWLLITALASALKTQGLLPRFCLSSFQLHLWKMWLKAARGRASQKCRTLGDFEFNIKWESFHLEFTRNMYCVFSQQILCTGVQQTTSVKHNSLTYSQYLEQAAMIIHYC